MAPSRRLRLAVIFAVLAAVFLAGAARPAPGGMMGGGEEAVAAAASYLQAMDPAEAALEKATRDTVEMLMARLPAGPSPRGPGH